EAAGRRRGAARRGGLEGGADRDRIRIVRVVEDAHTARVAPHAAPRHRPRLAEAAGDLVERPAQGHAHRRGGQRVRHVVPSDEGKRHRRASSARAAISPGCWLPISSTSAWCSAASRRSVNGSPHWLLKLPLGFSTCQRTPRTPAISSLVVVLPFEPVTATTGIENRARWYAASRPSARVVSSTSTSGTLAGTSSWSAWTTRHAAPREAASARNAWPSRR